jgi:hypothetical protein
MWKVYRFHGRRQALYCDEMANPEHLAIFNDGVASWNQYRRSLRRSDVIDLKSINIPNLELRDIQLDRALLASSDLHGVDFRTANLSGADLSGVNLIRADLRWANLADAKWPLPLAGEGRNERNQDRPKKAVIALATSLLFSIGSMCVSLSKSWIWAPGINPAVSSQALRSNN